MLKMTVVKETRKKEQRVAVTPEAVEKLRHIGIKVFIESDAGVLSGFDDAAYLQAGAEVTDDKQILYKDTQIVCWFKRPKNYIDEIQYIPGSSTLIGFLDPFIPDNGIQYCLDKDVTCFSWELLPNVEKFRTMHAFSRMGVLAGRTAYQYGLKKLNHGSGQRRSLNILIIGTGSVALAASEQAAADGHYLTIAGTNTRKKDDVQKRLKANFLPLDDNGTDEDQLLEKQQKQLLAEIKHCNPDIVITAARRYGTTAPVLLNQACMDALRPGTVVEDLTASVGGNTIFTEYDKDIKTSSGVLVCNRSNYPSDIPQQASQVYANCLLELLHYLEPGNKTSIADSLLHDPILKKAVITKLRL